MRRLIILALMLALAVPGAAIGASCIATSGDAIAETGEPVTFTVTDLDGTGQHDVSGTFVGVSEGGFGEPRTIAPAVNIVRDNGDQVHLKMSRILYVDSQGD